ALPAAPAGELVDYPAVAALKEQAFAALHERFARGHPALAEFHEWRAARGAPLESFARFEAIGLALRARTGRAVAWPDWPAELRRVDAPGVAAFAAEHAVAVECSAFLQWLAERQLTRTQQALMDAGMRIGLYADIAVGVVPDGADVWADPEAVVAGATIGAPPDAFSPKGQNWNVAPLSPVALRRRDMAPLRSILAAAMAHAGAVRIDHAMGLMRLFWIPAGGTPADGAYVRYPLHRMLATVAEASRAHDCLVIGEDLGTVAPGFREAMLDAGLLSYKVVWFERWESGLFHASGQYPQAALATISTHDLATVRGYLGGRDIDWRERAGQLDAAEAAAARDERTIDCQRLRDALRYEGLLDDDLSAGDEPEAIALALHRFLARTPSAIAMAQLEDLDGAVEQPNLPATIDEHPNWRRRTIHDIAGLLGSGPARRLIQALADERPRG
ncbi:MAG: 4-alpha-glucanotransferase, partial [Geminicoccaceae bacterium]